MIKKRRGVAEASVSFLDVISCGFGAIVLLLVIAPIGDPAALQEAEQSLQAVVRQLTEHLVDARGESVVLSEDLKSRKEQLSDLQDRVARLKAQLASVEKQSREIAQSKIVEEEQLRLAQQVLTEEMERLVPQDQIKNQLIGGVPVDSEYVIFVIDTSGSMQMAAWPRLRKELMNILNIYPTVIGIQVMSDEGGYMFQDTSRAWMRDSPEVRQRIIRELDTWAPFSDSSPVEGIMTAIQTYYRPDRKISIYVLGDDFSGRSIRAVVKAVDNLNQAQRGAERLVRIHAIGFPVHFSPGQTPNEGAIKFAALMRELSYNNGGTFIALTDLQP
jgi:hypothetical protein